MKPDDGWVGVAEAALRHGYSTKTIRRRIKNGTLPAQNEKIGGRDGRPVLKTVIRVSDLDDAFGWTDHEAHVRRIRASAQPLHFEQKVAIRDVFLEHLLEREEKRKRAGTDGVPA
ncbi:helix-turn-helix transcriptional regulator [Microbacterium karelineae]|uniref:helix-turn-helix transcriptional regulator n=1 Tax=Microbacterium karelineae TaxID=2654283 RepID=UPI0012E9AB75|nr:hypothetical protein [Microbacterium karelineae]